ncbi:hypothetical protein MWH25_01470 [Natroniella acetigena]|uniref:hypothetical protein n=1 Tax=Natroniella acetigena TaxID=52004 RepID=UPI00200A5BA9|nr:hypothetical protein [Natroniella acetigena]MCK8826417.1 hypothetical protein [Natroniella acetigena]
MSQTHKTDYTTDDAPTDDDFNRIEGNIKENRDDIDGLESDLSNIEITPDMQRFEAGDSILLENTRTIEESGSGSLTTSDYFEINFNANSLRFKYSLSGDSFGKFHLLLNGNKIGTTRTSTGTYEEDINMNFKPGDIIQVFLEHQTPFRDAFSRLNSVSILVNYGQTL